jgi:transposase-like protein
MKHTSIPVSAMTYPCHDCGLRSATWYNADGRYRCAACQRAWQDFVRKLTREPFPRVYRRFR